MGSAILVAAFRDIFRDSVAVVATPPSGINYAGVAPNTHVDYTAVEHTASMAITKDHVSWLAADQDNADNIATWLLQFVLARTGGQENEWSLDSHSQVYQSVLNPLITTAGKTPVTAAATVAPGTSENSSSYYLPVAKSNDETIMWIMRWWPRGDAVDGFDSWGGSVQSVRDDFTQSMKSQNGTPKTTQVAMGTNMVFTNTDPLLTFIPTIIPLKW